MERYSELENIIKDINAEISKQEKISQLINEIIDYVYKESSYDVLDYVIEHIDDLECFKMIQKEVRNTTDLFVKTLELRELSVETAIKVIRVTFEYRYSQYECEDYICQKEGFDNNLINPLKYFFEYCELYVIMRKISKRRFQKLLCEKGKFSERVFDETWQLFDKNRSSLDNKVLFKHLADIDAKVNGLLFNQKNLRTELLFIEYLIMKNSDKQDESNEQ